MKEKNITVSSAKLIKSGTTNGKNWSIFQLIDQDGWKFSTFEKQLAQLGISARVWYDEEDKTFQDQKTGKTVNYKSRTIRKYEVGAEFQSPNAPVQQKDGSPSDLEAILTQVQALEARIDALEANNTQPF